VDNFLLGKSIKMNKLTGGNVSSYRFNLYSVNQDLRLNIGQVCMIRDKLRNTK